MNRHLIIIIGLLLTALTAAAQVNTSRQILDQAEESYAIGRIEQAKSLLSEHFASFSGQLKTNACRLLSLCSIALDETEQAEQYAAQLLEVDPYYSVSSQDPRRFADIITRLKAGMNATITTASSQAETLSEVPVPTTLITEEMIRNCGARNLQGVLSAYVPGMHVIDCNDDINISMRGIYSNNQEKILFLLNGHRLNSYCTNAASPDYSISLEKIRQIEVLRGPASSIYGGVALTGVVNIITKQGADVDGVTVRAGGGNYGQVFGDAIFGKRYFDLDLLIWGSFYSSTGEEREAQPRGDIYGMPYPTITIGRVGDSPSYDFGMQMSWKGLRFLYDSHFSQIVAPYTMTTLATSYDHDRYRTHEGIFPSYATSSHHVDLSYTYQIGRLNLRGSLTYDKIDLTRYQVFYDGRLPELAKAITLPAAVAEVFVTHEGLSRYINGKEQDVGIQIKGDYSYIKNSEHQGSLAFGAEYTRFNLKDVSYVIGYDFVETMPESNQLQELGKGHETSSNVFIQLKHKWKSLIFNAGLRYDYKRRSDHTRLNEFSPRVSLIFLRPKWNVKLSFSKSYVDAPYLYRKINEFTAAQTDSASISLNASLFPERVNSFQVAYARTGLIKNLDFELNAFYNQATDLIMTHIIDYENGGRNKTVGLELMAAYRRPKFRADLALTWTHTFEANLLKVEATQFDMKGLYNTNIDCNNNTPAVEANAVLAWQVTPRLKLHTHLKFESEQSSYNTDLVRLIQFQQYYSMSMEFSKGGILDEARDYMALALEAITNVVTCYDMPARFLCNIGAEYQLIDRLTLALNIRNLFNTQYDRSGMNTKLVPQHGRWWTISVGYKF